ncbi:serine/arginine repetitive matrix protein 1-like isoform X4 [Lineus longissimus]|uniref:serine/arginine repetitive matrix protein 1-like isoform X4 n=1 Tax=Lineus longissimus TaxID=88925 RepID=UPI00315D3A75
MQHSSAVSNSETMDDSGRALLSMDIDRFTKLGHEELQNGDVTKAVEAFLFAFKQAKQFDDGYLERSCAFNLGAVYIASNNPEKGLELLQRAVPPMNKRDGSSNGDLYYNFGLGYESLKNSAEMVKYFQMALQEYELENNHEMIAALSKKLGQIYAKGSKSKEAADCYGKAAKAFGSLFQVEERILMLSNRAQQLLKVGDKTECLPTLDDCFQLCQKMENKSSQVKLYGDLGLFYTQCGDYGKACQCFQDALYIVKLVTTDKKKEAVIVQNLGAVYNTLGQYEEALNHHTAAAAMHAELGNRGAQGQCFSNAAYSYTQLGDNESAGEFYLHALQASKDAGDKHGEWQAMEGLGAVAFNRGLTDRAVQYFNKALVILSGCEQNLVAQERIVGKLTDAIQCKVAKASDGLPPLPVKHSLSTKESVQSIPVTMSKRELARSHSGRPPSVISLPTKQTPLYVPAPPMKDIDRNIRLLVNDESPSTRDFYRPTAPLTRRPRKISDTGLIIPYYNALGLSDYDSDTDLSLSTAPSSRRVSRSRRLSDEVDGMLKQFREDSYRSEDYYPYYQKPYNTPLWKGRTNRPLTARPERRKKKTSLTNEEVALIRAMRRGSRDTSEKSRQPVEAPKSSKKEKKRRLGARRPVSPSNVMVPHAKNVLSDRRLLRSNTFDSKENYRQRMKKLYKLSDSDIDWEYLNRIGPKPITPRESLIRGRSFVEEGVHIFSSKVSESSSSTSLSLDSKTTKESDSETETDTDSDEETIEEHQDNLPTSFNLDSIRYARTSEEYRRMMKEGREVRRYSPADPDKGVRPMSSRQRPSDRQRSYNGRPSSSKSRPKETDEIPKARVSPRAQAPPSPRQAQPSPRTQPSPREEASSIESPVPVSLPTQNLEMAPRPPESPRSPSQEHPPSRERFEKRMMEHMDAEKSEQRTNRIDSIDSAQSSSMADTDSRSNSRDPDYEDALPVETAVSPDAAPASSPRPLDRGVSLATSATDKSDNRDLEEYRRKLERRDASLDGTESISESNLSESGSLYTSSDSGTLTADEEPPYESIRLGTTGTPPPVPPPLESTYEKPTGAQPGPNFFRADTEEVEEKMTASEAVMGESGLYESIRTGKFEDVPPGVEPTAGDGTNGGEGTSQPVVPPRPPNIENMSRAEKEMKDNREKALYDYQVKRDEYQRRREERRKLQQASVEEKDDKLRARQRSRMCSVM